MDSEDIVIPNKPGYSVRTYKNEPFLVPRVLETREVLSLAPFCAPNLKEALEAPSGVGLSCSVVPEPLLI